jgi:transposase-like protein
MQEHPAVHNVTQAMRVLKNLPVQSPELAPIRDLSRGAIRQALEAVMDARIERYLGNVRVGPGTDRRNGRYRRWLLTGMGELELQVPRTRTRSAVEVLQADLDGWLKVYNEERTHQGRWCYGKTPMQTFLDSVPLAKEKMLVA